MSRVSQMLTARGTCIIAMCALLLLINTHPSRSKFLLPPRHLAETLAPPLARDDAGDEALSCRNLFDAVLTLVADLVFSAATVGVFCRQVRAREIELLGI